MNALNPDAPVDLSKPQREPTNPPATTTQRPQRPRRPRLLDGMVTPVGLISLALNAALFGFVGYGVGGFLAMSVGPLALIAWGAFEWLRDVAGHRDALEQWRDDVAAWEFEHRLDASRA